jgi:uncharacterized RDD family membrane protein YckC
MNPQTDLLTDIPFEENFGYTLATPIERLGGAFLEGLIIFLPLSFVPLFDMPMYAMDYLDFRNELVQAAVAGAFGAFFYSLWSGNLGHKILGLKVISAVDGSDEKKATIGASREILKTILGIVIIPSIWLLWDPKNQNLYDKITRTLVVKKPHR